MDTNHPSTPEQLLLLSEPGRVRPRVRLDDRTRRIGLAGVAEARAILAEQARRRAQAELADHAPFVREQAA
jgi:hypothetical protein